MALLFAVVDLGEQPAHEFDKHHHRIVGEFLAKLDDLRDDRRTPAAGIEVAGQPCRSGVTLADHLIPPPGRDTGLQTGIDPKHPQECDSFGQAHQVSRAWCLRR